MASNPPPATVRPRPYRDFLTPAWHRTFIRAAACSFALCCCIGFTFLSFSSLSIFLIFKAWIVGSLLFIPALCVFILRVAGTHVGSRTTPSPFDTVFTGLLSFDNIQLVFWYGVSTLVYTEVLVWSATSSDRIWLTTGSHERRRMQERAVLLRVMFATATASQLLWHGYNDKAKAPLPIPKSMTAMKDASPAQVTLPVTEIKEGAVPLLKSAAAKVVTSFATSLVLYYGFLRLTFWDLTFSIVSTFRDLPRYTAPTGIAPALPFFATVLWHSFLLTIIWDSSILLYDAFIAQPPLKLDAPLTNSSKDPNGSLITGLKAKKTFAKSNAFWELYLIAIRFPLRRVTIYTETDRQPAPTWVQIRDLCLAEVNAINARIGATKPQPPPAPAQAPPQRAPIAPPLKTDQITMATPASKRVLDRQLQIMGREVRAIGNSPGQGLQPVVHAAEWTAGQAVKRLPAAAKDALEPGHVKSQKDSLAIAVLRAPYVGPFFQRTFAKRATAVVCGTPYANTSLIVCAIQSLSLLVINSLKEDRYGQVAKDVGGIIRAFSSTLQAIDGYVAGLQPHWTDVTFNDKQRGEVEEVEAIKTALREGLKGMVGSFGEFASALGLNGKDLSIAKALTASGPEMKKAIK